MRSSFGPMAGAPRSAALGGPPRNAPGGQPPPSYAPVAAAAPMSMPEGRAADADAFDGSAPAAPPPMQPQQLHRDEAKREKGKSEEKLVSLEAERSVGRPADAKAAMPVASAYHAQLATLARELDAQGRGRADAAAIRVLRQRLTEWCEDLRSVGGKEDLASAVEHLVQRLSAALAAATNLAGETIAVAAELTRLANGAPPPPAPKKSRAAFWK